MGVEADIEDGIQDIERWLGIEEENVVGVLKRTIQDMIAAGKQGLLQDIIADTPAAVAAELTGGPAATVAVMATDLGTQGKALAQTTLTGIRAG